MAPKITLSGPARKQLIADLMAALTRLQNDGGLSFTASMAVSMLVAWLQKEYLRLDAAYPTATTKPQWPTGE